MSDDRRSGVPPLNSSEQTPSHVLPWGDGIAKNAAGRRIYRDFGYFQPKEPVADLAGNLPHWRQEGVTYFVTFRLADSLPHTKLDEWLRERDAWLVTHPKPWDDATGIAYHRRFTAKFEKWLDAGHGSCILARNEIRSIVANALRHFDGARYWLDSGS